MGPGNVLPFLVESAKFEDAVPGCAVQMCAVRIVLRAHFPRHHGSISFTHKSISGVVS